MAKLFKRFLVSSLLDGWRGGESKVVLLTPEEAHHIKNVLRIQEGSQCLLIDREGNEFVSRLNRFLPDRRIEAELIELVSSKEIDPLELTVAQTIPQDRKMDEMVEKATELGVFELVPLVTEHTVPRIEAEKFDKMHKRWIRIAEQTLKQCRLSRIPKISSLHDFNELCKRVSQYDSAFVCHPSREAKSFFRDLDFGQLKDKTRRILLAIGPEGGFSDKEINQAQAAGMEMIRLGRGILKTDTAFVAASSFFRLIYS